MPHEIVPIPPRQLGRAGLDRLPAMIAGAGEQAAWRFVEFFTANIRNKNTRNAYAQAVTQFFDWLQARRIHQLDQIRPVVIAGYIEEPPPGQPPRSSSTSRPSACFLTTWSSARWSP